MISHIYIYLFIYLFIFIYIHTYYHILLTVLVVSVSDPRISSWMSWDPSWQFGQVQAAQTPGLESYAGLMAEALNGNGNSAQRLGEALLELLKALRGLGFEIQTHFCESVPGLIRLGNLLPT